MGASSRYQVVGSNLEAMAPKFSVCALDGLMCVSAAKLWCGSDILVRVTTNT